MSIKSAIKEILSNPNNIIKQKEISGQATDISAVTKKSKMLSNPDSIIDTTHPGMKKK